MIRRKFYVPKDEIARNYYDYSDKKAYNFFYESDYDDKDSI